MTYAFHWRKAITASLLLHLLFLSIAGYAVASLALMQPPEETLLSLDLAPAPEAAAAPAAAAVSPIPPAAVPEPVFQQELVAPPSPDGLEDPPPEQPNKLQQFTPTSPGPVSGAASGALGSSAAGSGAAAGETSGKGGIIAPSILSRVEPVYPASARKAGQEGTVLLRIEIQSNGRPGSIEILSSSGYQALDEAAVNAAEKWRFVPAKEKQSNRAIACTTTLPVSFRLR